jgi:lipopolysaccharide heptosyltransferase III
VSNKPEQILFITLSCVGDAVMTTSVLQALHKVYPKASIDIVADRRSDILFKNCPFRGDIFYKDKGKFLRGAPALIKQLAAKRYDVIVDLRTDGLAYLLKGEKRFTKWNGESYGLHAVESLMGIIRNIYGDQPIPVPHIWLEEDNIAFAKEIVAAFPGNNILAIGPGCSGKKPEKFWPTKSYVLLANGLKDIFDTVLLLGGSGDKELVMEIVDELKLPYIDMCDKTDLLQAAALLHLSKVFVGSDSGLGHVAAAVDTSTLSFFSVDDPERCLPWGPSASWLMGKNRDARNISVIEADAMIRTAISG